MVKRIRQLIPHSIINVGKHLPHAILANLKYGFPGQKLRIIGVTGTDGKTTTVNMIYQILKNAGKKASMISTINAYIGGKEYDTGFHVTSPDPSLVQKLLKEALVAGDEFMVLEVTSHALAQFRVWGVNFEIGVITNVTHEHLDYHKTFENYMKTKMKLIKMAKVGIVNTRVRGTMGDMGEKGNKVRTFGLNEGDFSQKDLKLKLKIAGDYNIENALAAIGVASILGIDMEVAKKSLENFVGLTGRMEEIKNNKGIKIVVDFAHTPNALESALRTLRSQTKGKLIAVFGAAAERDKEKRPMMGETSGKLADITVLTDEDPRFEDRNKIINEIAMGAHKAGGVEEKTIFRQPDREKAIQMAIQMAKAGDVVGIFGKGHERAMSYQGVEKTWSDQEAARKALR